MLASAGFDVWLGNSRGNMYSNKHIKLDAVKDKKQFYDFTFQEIGMFDLPAMIEKILDKTKAE